MKKTSLALAMILIAMASKVNAQYAGTQPPDSNSKFAIHFIHYPLYGVYKLIAANSVNGNDTWTFKNSAGEKVVIEWNLYATKLNAGNLTVSIFNTQGELMYDPVDVYSREEGILWATIDDYGNTPYLTQALTKAAEIMNMPDKAGSQWLLQFKN
jgi:hypothetical protein